MFGDFKVDGGLIAAFIAAGISTLGLISMAAIGDWGRRNSPYFSAFAVGLLTVAVLFHLIPEAVSENPDAWKWVLGGFTLLTLLAVLLSNFAKRGAEGADVALGYASTIAVGSHSFMDGFVYEATFRDFGIFHDNIFTGAVTTTGLMLHEYPEGVIAFYLLREAGLEKFRAGMLAFFVASVTTIAGAIGGDIVFDFLPWLQPSVILALTAGGLIYLLVFHLGPHARLTPKRRGYAVASLGVIISLAAILVHAAGEAG